MKKLFCSFEIESVNCEQILTKYPAFGIMTVYNRLQIQYNNIKDVRVYENHHQKDGL